MGNWNLPFRRKKKTAQEVVLIEHREPRLVRHWQSPEDNNAAAKWRKRVSDRNQIFTELKKLGSFAALSCGSLLIYPSFDGSIRAFESSSRWKETLQNSELYGALTPRAKGILRCSKERYRNLEEALQAFGRMIVLSVRDLEDKFLIESFAFLKKEAVTHGLSPSVHDDFISYIKWLAKVAQATLLQAEIPVPPITPIEVLDNEGEAILVPFAGQLSFISRIFYQRRERNLGLKLAEARCLAQIANTTRALPFPSSEQIQLSVEKSVKTLMTEKKISNRTLNEYERGLMKYASFIKKGGVPKRTHVSLTNSACLEASRSQGGKAAVQVAALKNITDVKVDDVVLKGLINMVDTLKRPFLEPVNVLLIRKWFENNPGLSLTLGDILYHKSDELIPYLNSIKNLIETNQSRVPANLGWIMVNQASVEILEYGTYSVPYSIEYGLLCFHKKALTEEPIRFRRIKDSIPVRASLSIEAGLKTRLVTAAPYGHNLIGQLIGNALRGALSQDPLVRVGFNEPDKLWEVLKVYKKRNKRS